MKDRALELCRGALDIHKKNILREYLQAHILYSMQGTGVFRSIAFHGGTALRFLYQLKRFSEDLDFALEYPPIHLTSVKEQILADFTDSGFEVRVYEKKREAVHALSFRVPHLLYEAGLSKRRDENLTVHVEVDTRPPLGAKVETTLVNRFFLLSIRHHDLASAFAGKLCAILTRSYTKGRDLYDLLWYLTRMEPTMPNFELLNNALRQMHWKGEMDEGSWKSVIWKKVKGLNWSEVVRDVNPFLENPREAELLTPETFDRLLSIP